MAFCSMLILAGVISGTPPSAQIVPLPQEVRRQPGAFDVSANPVIWLGVGAAAADKVAAEDLVRDVKQKTGVQLTVRKSPDKSVPPKGIVLGDEGRFPGLASALKKVGCPVPRHEQAYALVVSPQRILICGHDPAGAYYGARTLVQLLSKTQDRAMAAGTLIRDWPDLPWRGVMEWRLNPGEGYQEKARVFIDQCAAVKLNLFYVAGGMDYAEDPDEKGRAINEGLKNTVAYARSRHMRIIADCRARKFPMLHRKDKSKQVYWFPDPRGKRLVTKRLNRLIDLLNPDAVCIGQDELVTSYASHLRKSVLKNRGVGRKFAPPRAKYDGVPPHKLWADFIRFYRDVLKKRNVEMCLWADCLLSGQEFDGQPTGQTDGIYGGLPDKLYLARQYVPKDILLFDWHYPTMWRYPSVDVLTGAGFDIMAAPWWQPGNTYFFCKQLKERGGKHARGLFNTWWFPKRPVGPQLPHIADCAWTVGRLAQMPGRLRKLIAVAEEAAKKPLEHLRPGAFRKDINLHPAHGGHFFCSGWTDGRMGLSVGFAFKRGRKGYVDYRFAADGGTFREFRIQPWFANIGENAILVGLPSDGGEKWVTVSESRDWNGESLDLSKNVVGVRAFRLRFRAYNASKKKGLKPCLTRFIVEGKVVAHSGGSAVK